jgi:hypothetical protein
LAIGFVFPAIAREQKTVDPEVRQQIEASFMKLEEAYNKYGRLLLRLPLPQMRSIGWGGKVL